jgi:hypothetical protein
MKRVTSSDVLSLLREYKLEKKPIRQKEFFLYFNNNKFPLNIFLLNVLKAWKSKLTEKRYDLGSLWLLLEHHERQSSTSLYYADVEKLKLSLVSNVDKEEIINYFTGKIEFSDAINQEFRLFSI